MFSLALLPVPWLALGGLTCALGGVTLIVLIRRAELSSMARRRAERETARALGTHRARLQYPAVDLSRCIGCGTCVVACPEEGVLDLLHGQAVVVHGARCVGHARCAEECPTGAIAVTLGDLSERRDIPALTDGLEAVGTPGLFLAGEVTGYALIRTAVAQGTAVAAAVARRRSELPPAGREILDLCIVGAGPAGLACSLEACRCDLSFVTLEQSDLGGTVASYPRRKLVMTQPVELPLYGKLDRPTYSKEDLMELWESLAQEHSLPVRSGVRFQGVTQLEDGCFEVATSQGPVVARNVCLALGRRGTPRKLGVPGEELPKVAYGLLDAQSYADRDVLVVGGGDSAIEAALGLAETGNRVTLAYRKPAFFRLKARNSERLEEALAARELDVLFSCEVQSIEPDVVHLQGTGDGELEPRRLPNDEVFVLAGGQPPFPLLEASGVSFDPAARPQTVGQSASGRGLVRALLAGFFLALMGMAWALYYRDYYALPRSQRPASELHDLLHSSSSVGLGLGIAACLLILFNLAYLARKNPRVPFRLGPLQAWMTVHVATGILALLLVLLHAALNLENTVGGHALIALAVLVITGAIGRYFYAYVPRAANGRELAIEEVQASLTALEAEWDREDRAFGDRVRGEVDSLVQGGGWRGSFFGRVAALWLSQRRLSAVLGRLTDDARREGLSEDRIAGLCDLARRAQRNALAATHFEELRGILASWRWLHRWVALLMVLLAVIHILTALRFGSVLR